MTKESFDNWRLESMEKIDKKWYQRVFRNHEDWEQGLPQTIEDLKQLQEEKVIG